MTTTSILPGLAPLPTDRRVADRGGELQRAYQKWFSSIQYYLSPVGTYGATASRPVNAGTPGSNPSRPLYIGQSYFDTTLNKPIWVKSLNPTVWVDATGGVV